MKRLLFLFLLAIPLMASGQVVNFAKTLPQRAYSVTLSPAYHADRNVILFEGGGPSVSIKGGYGVLYSLDVNARIIYFVNGPAYFGADVQYLVHEARKTYVSVIGGLHYYDYFGTDITALLTYTPRFELSLSTGLDFDLNFGTDVFTRLWIPLNVGYQITEMIFLFGEYSLPISDRSWDIFSLGANFIFR
jgi:hypothetical protein